MQDAEMLGIKNRDAEVKGCGEDGEEDCEDGTGWYDYDEEEIDIVKKSSYVQNCNLFAK